ncbi:MAG: universal stress protein [Deltaproteobacteria bacterium]|nr:MAG: universal stress protein [Deltaproteobacteria bacterium]
MSDQNILVAVDETGATERVLDYLTPFVLARPECRLHLVCVAEGVPADSQELAALEKGEPFPELHGDVDHRKQIESLMQALDRAVERLKAAGIAEERISRQLRGERGGVAADLLEEAVRHGCSTLVVGRHRGERLRHFLFGSTAARLLEDLSDMVLWVVP